MAILKFEVGTVMRNIISHVDAKPASRLVLVKNHGIYITPVGAGPDKVIYAEGCDPNVECETLRLDVYDRCAAFVGGDDFANDIPLEWLRMAVDFSWRWLQVRVDDNKFVMINGTGSSMPKIFCGGRDDDK
ncbi:DUF3085 domain-containing protein [Magnetovibrio sp. PR-2]|uniref:DUF3085 domain-containing protein n=1 Tax=Magnetovibrio sp. PR-2 TaxID=3120356 RepID=UPI002FCE657D